MARTQRRTRPVQKRTISDPVEVDGDLLGRVSYKPHPQHCKKPDTWAPHKTKCPDGVGCPAALAMLKEGLRRSMVPPGSEGLPSPVWAVDDNTGQAYEARVTNRGTAEYHGYPVLDRDPLKDEILAKWQERAI